MGTSSEAIAMIDAALVAIHGPSSDVALWLAFDAKARREESRYQAAALAQFRAERERIIDRIRSAVPSTKGHDPTDPHPSVADPYVEAALIRIAADYAPGGTYHTEWLQRYRRLIGSTVQLGARGVNARTGLSFNLSNPRAVAAVQRRVLKLAGNVTQTTLQRVRDIITQGRTEGIGVTELARRIREDAFGGSVSLSRARTIARTETVGALNEGAFEAANTNGVMQSKRWLDQKDGRVRDSHVTAAGDGWIALDARFSNGLLYPHEGGAPAAEVINCRCTLLYSDLSPAEARGRPT